MNGWMRMIGEGGGDHSTRMIVGATNGASIPLVAAGMRMTLGSGFAGRKTPGGAVAMVQVITAKDRTAAMTTGTLRRAITSRFLS